MSAHLLKGLYVAEKAHSQDQVFRALLSKLPNLKTFGINTQEYLAVLGAMINEETAAQDKSIMK